MTRKRKRIRAEHSLAGLLLLLAAAGPAAASGGGEPGAQLQRAIETLRDQQRRLRSRRDRLGNELAGTDRRIGELAREMRRLDEQRRTLEQRLAKLRREQGRHRQQVRLLRRQLAALVRAAYLSGREERLKLLLNQGDPALLNRMLAYHDYLARTRVEKIRQLERRLQELQELEAQVQESQAELERNTARIAEQRRRLQQEKKTREQLLARLERDLRKGDERLRRMQEDARRLTEVVKESARALRALELPEQASFAQRRGKLEWPLAGRLVVPFGREKIGNLRWDGVIIGAPEGREVKAVHSGRVAYADWLRGYGLLIILDHGDGYMSLYGHNQSLLKETGDWVEAGEVIGLAGRSGGLRQPGIYFGIRHDGKPEDPVRWCRRKSGRKAGRGKS